MTKSLLAMSMVFLLAPAFAHDVGNPDELGFPGVVQMVRLHAQKVCAQAYSVRFRCEGEQIKSLSETVASVSLLRPASVSPREFASMIEKAAGQRRVDIGDSGMSVDCRVNVC